MLHAVLRQIYTTFTLLFSLVCSPLLDAEPRYVSLSGNSRSRSLQRGLSYRLCITNRTFQATCMSASLCLQPSAGSFTRFSPSWFLLVTSGHNLRHANKRMVPAVLERLRRRPSTSSNLSHPPPSPHLQPLPDWVDTAWGCH